jgi:hypothetical protein
MKDLTNAMEQFQPYVQAIETILGHKPTQVNLFGYAVEIFLDENWDRMGKTEGRLEVLFLVGACRRSQF